MADDALTRKRRQRAHEAGDHRLCNPSRCSDAAPEGDGELEAVVGRYVDELGLSGEGAVLVVLAKQLARALDRQTTAAAARELRETVARLAEVAQVAGERQAQGRAEELVASLRGVVG
jgi:hypothetical protein